MENPLDLIKPSGACANGSKDVTIGTSSLRRIAQLKNMNPSIKIVDIRGNLNTRLSKLDDPHLPYEALILASAGLRRSHYSSRISHRLVDEGWYHAVGQGALAVECRTEDTFVTNLLSPLIDYRTTFECLAERTFMQHLEGGCSIPIGVKCSWTDTNDDPLILTLSGIVLNLEGDKKVEDRITINLNETPVSDCDTHLPSNYTHIKTPGDDQQNKFLINRYKNSIRAGYKLSQRLLQSGARHILNDIKK